MTDIATKLGPLSVAATGDGPPILWIHAFPLSGAMWRGQVEAIRGFRHVVPDLPGFGKSPVPKSAYTLDDVADALAAALDALKIEKAAVAGLSMGGYVLFALLRRRTSAVSAALLCDTKASADGDEAKENREKFARVVLEKGADFAAREMPGKLLTPDADPAVVAAVEAMIRANPKEGIAAAQRAMAARPDSTSLLASLRVPTLVLVGSKDTLTPPAESEKMAAAVPGARLAVIPGGGHLTNLERPGEFNGAVRAFLEGGALARTEDAGGS